MHHTSPDAPEYAKHARLRKEFEQECRKAHEANTRISNMAKQEEAVRECGWSFKRSQEEVA